MKKNIDDLELEVKKLGTFYRDKNEALTFKLKNTEKTIYWQKNETYREFLERCKVLSNCT